MRGCEIALDDGEAFELSEHLTPQDVKFFETDGVRCATMRIRKRKDLRVLRGKHSSITLAGGGKLLDPVAALHEWMQARALLGLSPAKPALFCHENGSAITVRELRQMVKEVAAAAGLDETKYGAHSLRIGGATAALAAGVSPSLIRLLGRWSSDVYEIYTRMSLQSALSVGRAITSTEVDTFEEQGFHEEHLELLPFEVKLLHGTPEEVDLEDAM